MLSGVLEPPRRGPAHDARVKALLLDYRCCLTCGMVYVPASVCPSGVHAYCARCPPKPCRCQQ